MSKLLRFLGLTLGSWIGWYVGAQFSLAAAILLGVIGTGVGLYVGIRITQDYF